MVGGFSTHSHTAAASSKPQWDPRSVIAIDNPRWSGPTCVGRAQSGNRCGWFSSGLNPRAAEDALDKISLQAPDAAALEARLFEVARAMLCHHHPNQARTVVGDWQAAIRVVARDYVPQAVQLEPARLAQPDRDASADFKTQMVTLQAQLEGIVLKNKNDAEAADLAKRKAQDAEARLEAARRDTKLAHERADKLAADREVERAAAAAEENKRLAVLRERAAAQLEQAERERQALLQERSAFEKERKALKKERSVLGEERTVLEEKRSVLEEERSVLEEERSVLEEERSVLGEERSELMEGYSTLESRRATVLAVAQATEQWTAEVDKWKTEAKAQKNYKLSVRTLRRRLVVPAGVLDSMPAPPSAVAQVSTGPLAGPTVVGGPVLGETTVTGPALPEMPDVPTTEPVRQSPVEEKEEREETSKPEARKLRALPRRRAKEMAN